MNTPQSNEQYVDDPRDFADACVCGQRWHRDAQLQRGRPYDGAVIDEDGRLVIPDREARDGK